MIQSLKLSYRGMSQDSTKSKHPYEFYFEGRNIRIVSTNQQSTGSITNERGNEILVTIPTPVIDIENTRVTYSSNAVSGSGANEVFYRRTGATIPGCEIERNYYDATLPGTTFDKTLTSGQQVIIGRVEARDSVIIASTDGNGFDCIWELSGLDTEDFAITLKYIRNLNFKKEKLIQLLYNYENSILEKVYWVDGENQLRFMNLRHSIENGDLEELIDMPSNSIDTVGDFSLSQPIVTNFVGGGGHTAGMIQYAYNLYRLNGSQTTVSPVSEMYPLDKGVGQGGAEVNTSVGRTVVLGIDGLDINYTHIKLYSIKYTSYGEIPRISLILDREIDDYERLVYHDDGVTLGDLSIEQFLFLGSNPIIPKHIESKDSRLFPISIKEKNFDVDLDCRAYSFDSNGEAQVRDNIAFTTVNGVPVITGPLVTIDTATWNLTDTHDAINKDYNVYRYQSNGTTLGAEGKYFKVEIDNSVMPRDEAINKRFFKDRELYRIGIQLYNRLGQKSTAKWMCDYKMPSGNLNDEYNKLSIELKPEFFTWLDAITATAHPDDVPVGYKVIRADRLLRDQTIVTQGITGTMIANHRHGGKDVSLSSRQAAANKQSTTKMPSLIRHFDDRIVPIVGYKNYHCLAWRKKSDSSFDDLDRSRQTEGFKAAPSGQWRAQNYQFNHLMTLHSPETIFGNPELDASLKFKTVGVMRETERNCWAAERSASSGGNYSEAKFRNGFNSSTPGVSIETINPSASSIFDFGMFGPTNTDHGYHIWQMDRQFTGIFTYDSRDDYVYDIYGTPEIMERGQDFKTYSGDSRLRFAGHLRTMLMDNFDQNSTHNDSEQQIIGTNSDMSRCIIFAEGNGDSSTPLETRKGLGEIYDEMGINDPLSCIIGEIVKDPSSLYIGNLYGGNSSEAKSSTEYIEIGEYQDFSAVPYLIDSPGDTYVQDFAFARITKGDVEIKSTRFHQMTEMITVRLETQVDLKNRHDISRFGWDNRFQPRHEEFHQYNTVYSQQANLIKNTDIGFKFKKVKSFDTRIISSKEKIPGEDVDSWTDMEVNTVMDLDGSYGPINGVVNLKDEIFTFQDTGVAHISINPRVQVSGSDGAEVELGTGKVLHEYRYVTTKSGCVNKWSIFSSPSAFYYVDVINKGIGMYHGQVQGITDSAGMHQFMINNMNEEALRVDNPVLGSGISGGFNTSTNDAYFTFKQGVVGNSFTIAYNEATGTFVSFYDYKPSWYVNKGDMMITTGLESASLWQHFKGQRNMFYGEVFPSEVTFNLNPQTDRDVVFNNAEFKMEMETSGDVDVPLGSFSRMQIWNDYQDSQDTVLAVRKNINRKFRSWKVSFPRNKGTKDRIRSPWAKLRFSLDNPDGKKMVLHDMNVYYTLY